MRGDVRRVRGVRGDVRRVRGVRGEREEGQGREGDVTGVAVWCGQSAWTRKPLKAVGVS